jgi:ABC-type transporter Mla MlaB component
MNRQSDPEEGGGAGRGSGGLLSKVVKFVKSPTTHWADLDRPEAEPGGDTQSRLALKEMIERKRRNDFVRNREFDMLRKLRRKETLRDDEALPGQASFYPSSQPANTGERARTLKKIDEIEAQMATAWFRRKAGDTHQAPAQAQDEAGLDAAHEHLNEGESQPGGDPHAAFDPSSPAPVGDEPDQFAAPAHDAPLRPAAVQAFAPTEPMDHAAFEADLARLRRRRPEAGAATATAAAPAAAVALGPLGMNDFQVEVVAEASLDPAIEEAAIRFANGDAAGAEAGLRELVADGAEREDHIDTWLTLFDLYRATGEQAKFDDTALHFAARFGRSAPQWGAESGAGSRPAPVAEASTGAASTARFHWVCPSALGVQSMAALNASLARNAPPWRIDWRNLKSIDPAALPALFDLFQRWALEPVRLKLLGVESALDVLAEQSPTDDRSVEPLWWQARLALLRVLGDMDEFELVALNYCVTYEVSPPAWEEPHNSWSPMTEEGHTIVPSEEAPPAVPSRSFGATDLAGVPVNVVEDGVVHAELSGELLGSADSALQALHVGAASGVIDINCRALSRVDFGAAGDLLNWSLEHKGHGRQVVFRQVNRLVAAFFGVIGVTDAARVALRVD